MKKYNDQIRAQIAAQRDLGMKGDFWNNHAIARGVVNEDIDPDNYVHGMYHLNETMRDTLLAHTREDAAHALLNTTSLLKRVRLLTWLVYLLLAIAIVREVPRWLH
jgi:hypothetical protein